MKRLLGMAALSGVLLAAAWFGWRQYEEAWLQRPMPALATAATFEIDPGASLQSVAQKLAGRGLLEHSGIWIRHAKRTGDATRIKAGEYEIRPGTTPAVLLQQFVAGDVRLYTVTIPEGWTARQALAAIQSHPEIEVELSGLSDREWMQRLGLADLHPEGQFFPDTYRFPRGATDRAVLLLAHARLERELAAAWQGRAADLPLRTAYEVLILASIIEKETGVPDERPLIGGVFTNRLRLGMRLQTDPTVIYGLGESFDGNLRRRDLLADTPYNSYTRAGLPPTPIALPGRAALEAAVRPETTDALYFVATGTGDGRHYFAETLVAHNANVSRHLANLRGGSGVQVR
ncbi:MAG TPA: endolytic transglycosylase MltG [Steroidobacteraceae bacterium]|nr:endolytic transglycosylase MltG [Steroidobacteraceae bacterium]